MPLEIERKFLVSNPSWRSVCSCGIFYTQGYLCKIPQRTVRVRMAGENGYLTIKGQNNGIIRSEWEYPIPITDAQSLLDICEKPLVQKIRYTIPWGNLIWEVDEFLAEKQGLVLAEIELPFADYAFELPNWIGEEVSHNPRYFNSNLYA